MKWTNKYHENFRNEKIQGNMNIKISIIVPVYNIEKYISECIESIINQTYKNLQIILVDDGSTDKSGIICDEYARKDTRINVIHQKNGGLVSARKSGLRNVEGEFVGFVDGDDYIEPDMYEKLVKEMQSKDADVVSSGYYINGKIFTDKKAIIDTKQYREKLIKAALLKEGLNHNLCFKLLKRPLIQECYSSVNDEACYGEDLICYFEILLNAKKICVLDKAFYYYRMREDSIMHKANSNRLRQENILYENVYQILKSADCVDLYEKELQFFYLHHISNGIIHVCQDDFIVEKYHFSDVSKVQGKKIIVYGAGCVGKDYYSQFSRYTDCEVVAWVDSQPEKYRYPYIKVFGKDCLLEKEYDVIVVAVKKEEVYLDIKKNLLEMGILEEKIMWNIPHVKFW